MTDNERALMTEIVLETTGPMLHANDLMFRFSSDKFSGQDQFIMYSEMPGNDIRVAIDITGWFDELHDPPEDIEARAVSVKQAIDDIEGLIDYTVVVCQHPEGIEAIGGKDPDAPSDGDTAAE